MSRTILTIILIAGTAVAIALIAVATMGGGGMMGRMMSGMGGPDGMTMCPM